jgi:hypothetical protein
VLVHRLEEILARTDPFDLAQAIDRRVGETPARRITGMIAAASERLSAYYRDQFLPILQLNDEDAVRATFSRALKANLRAVSLFGRDFAESVLAYVPSDRAIGIGEEQQFARRTAAALVATAFVAAVAGGAADRYLKDRRAVAPAPPPIALMAPTEPALTPAPVVRLRRNAPHRRRRVVAAAAVAPAPAPPPSTPAVQVEAAPLPVRRRLRTPPPGRGVLTVRLAPPPVPAAQPDPQALDVSDMPGPLTDATPLPSASVAPAIVTHAVAPRTPVPTPRPRGHSWLHRTIMHLDPFKHHP